MEEVELRGDRIKPAEDGYVSAHDAERLMVVYQLLSEDWAEHVANALFYKEDARFKKDAAYNMAFLKSEAKSDRQRDVDAKNDPQVRMAEAKLIEATAALKLTELHYDGAVRAYHAMKKILEVSQEEKKWL